MKSNQYLTILFISTILFSCKKEKVSEPWEQFPGDYYCRVDAGGFTITDGGWDTTYMTTITVSQEGTNFKIFNNLIPIDSVKNGEQYMVGNFSSHYTVQFKNDSLFYYSYSGGLGGNSHSDVRGPKL